MPLTSVSITSASTGTASAPIALNWRGGRPVLWQVVVSSSIATGDFTVQYTLDDIQLTTYSTAYPPVGSPTVATVNIWSALSSTPYTTVSSTGSVGIHFNSSNIFPDGISGTFLAPPCALRLFSTTISSGILTMRVVQGDGG